MARLARFVHVGGKVYAPGDEPPAEVARKITNPNAWEGGALPSSTPPPIDDPEGSGGGEVQGGGEPAVREVVGSVPKRAGAGSSVEDWRRFAADNGVEVADDASRADIITAVEAAGLVEKQ